MYDFVRGPLVWVAFLVFIFGTAYQIYRFYRLSRPKERFRLRIPFGKPPKDPGEAPAEPELTWWQQAQLSVAGKNPVMITVTTLFHLALVLTPLFVLGHNVLLDLAWQVSLPSLPEAVADGFTMVVIAGGLFFLLRRIFLARVRAISTAYDYLVLLAATAPFITGFLAYHTFRLRYGGVAAHAVRRNHADGGAVHQTGAYAIFLHQPVRTGPREYHGRRRKPRLALNSVFQRRQQ